MLSRRDWENISNFGYWRRSNSECCKLEQSLTVHSQTSPASIAFKIWQLYVETWHAGLSRARVFCYACSGALGLGRSCGTWRIEIGTEYFAAPHQPMWSAPSRFSIRRASRLLRFSPLISGFTDGEGLESQYLQLTWTTGPFGSGNSLTVLTI